LTTRAQRCERVCRICRSRGFSGGSPGRPVKAGHLTTYRPLRRHVRPRGRTHRAAGRSPGPARTAPTGALWTADEGPWIGERGAGADTAGPDPHRHYQGLRTACPRFWLFRGPVPLFPMSRWWGLWQGPPPRPNRPHAGAERGPTRPPPSRLTTHSEQTARTRRRPQAGTQAPTFAHVGL
jgi:hypothetical protein